MPKIEEFEDLECWKESRVLVNEVYELTNNGGLYKDFGLRNQIQRTSVSAMTNISEGFARYSSKEFIHFLDFTQSSCEEVESLLYVAFDQKHITKSEMKKVYNKANDVRNMTLGFIKYLRCQEVRNLKTSTLLHLNT